MKQQTFPGGTMLHIRLIILSIWLLVSLGACGTIDTVANSQESHNGSSESQLFTLDDYSYPLEHIQESQVASPKPSHTRPRVTRVGFNHSFRPQNFLMGRPTVHFDFNSWSIAPKWRKVLDKTADQLNKKQNYWVEIEGHCDQRGTEAYNMVLGEKRAHAVRDYLVDLGVEQTRILPFSYGKTTPYCQDNEVTCHDMNRRAEMVFHPSKP